MAPGLAAEFDEKVQQSKDDAEDALERIPEIEARIEQAEDKTRQAEQNLAGAEADAIMARDIAKEAENVAKMASDVSVVSLQARGFDFCVPRVLCNHNVRVCLCYSGRGGRGVLGSGSNSRSHPGPEMEELRGETADFFDGLS